MWLSFLVHQKITLTVDQAEIHIMAPLLFQFNSDLQHRITDFIGERTFSTDQFFDLQSLLKAIEYLLQHHNSYRRELSKDDKSNLFKAYLIVCNDYLVQKEEVNQDGTYSADDMLKFYMTFALRMNTVLCIKDSLIELVKSKLIIALKQYRLYHSNDTTLLAWLQVSLFTWLAIPVKRVIGTWS